MMAILLVATGGLVHADDQKMDEFGVKVGVGFVSQTQSSIDTPPSDMQFFTLSKPDNKFSSGFTFGGIYSHSLGDGSKLKAKIELLYSDNSVESTWKSNSYNSHNGDMVYEGKLSYTFSTIQLPVMISYDLGNGLGVYAGPQFSLVAGQKIHFESVNTVSSPNSVTKLSADSGGEIIAGASSRWGLVWGVTYRVNAFVIDLRYDSALSNTYGKIDDQTTISVMQNCRLSPVSISLGYMF